MLYEFQLTLKHVKRNWFLITIALRISKRPVKMPLKNKNQACQDSFLFFEILNEWELQYTWSGTVSSVFDSKDTPILLCKFMYIL